jgi:IclR family transcriptional regulator, acetate operon repressor
MFSRMSAALPTEDNSDDPRAASSAASRSLALLALLAGTGRALSLAELAMRLSLPKATTHRLCVQLVEGGYITRGLAEREFVVGPALRQLALDTLNHGTVRGLRHDVLAALVRDVGETCNFTTLDGASVLYLDRVEAPWPWRLTLDVGAHVPLHCTASGKLFLALMTPRPRRALMAGLTLTRMTERTVVTAPALDAEFKLIAQRGYALDDEEFITGLVALAVPVRDAQGAVRAALAVHAPKARMSVASARECLPAMLAAAERMRHLL